LMIFIVDLVSVSMEKCSPYMYCMEDLFFLYSHLKKKFLLFLHLFSQSAVDDNLTALGSSDIRNGLKTPSQAQWLRCRPPVNTHIPPHVCCAFPIGLTPCPWT